MATLADLNNITREPKTVQDWLDKFTPEEQTNITHAIFTHSQTQVWEILANLDENPFPFGQATLNSWKHRNKPRGAA